MITVKRTAICRVLTEKNINNPILLPYPQEEIQELFFDKVCDKDGIEYLEINPIIESIISKIDCSNISFDNVNLSHKNLYDAYNVKFNPQNIYQKNLNSTILGRNIEIIDNENINQKDLFEDVDIVGTEFNDCKNVRINPQTVHNKDFTGSTLEGVDFTGFSFDGAILWNANFTGSIGAIIDPHKTKYIDMVKSLKGVILTDLPQNDKLENTSTAKNYQELTKALTDFQSNFIELIKDQLPEEKIEEINPVPPKQKRKWF